MKGRILFLIWIVCNHVSYGQKHISTSSHIRFYSSAPIEDIEATNTKSKSVIDLSDGRLVFSIPNQHFIFDQKLMQEHFNENYMETEKYPKSTFQGKVIGWKMFEGKKKVVVSGEMNIHGQLQSVKLSGDLEIKKDKIIVDANFPIALNEYKIKIPKAVFYNIADTVEVTVHFEYIPNKE